jgi:pimeloyl-ACP methyl ester carboxylesterase
VTPILGPRVSSDSQVALASDGRTLTFAEWGDPDGFPVFFLHGTPNSRFARHYDESKYVEAGARVITYDRSGYGGSDRHRGRRVVDCVGDVAAIADTLGIDRFAAMGASGGGPHALAVAAGLPERVTRAACNVGPAPFDVADFDWFEGMDPLNVQEFEWALQGEEVLLPELRREAGEILESVAADPAKILGDEWGLSDADRAELARPERHDVIRQDVSEAFRTGVWGWVDDDLCLVGPWGFDVGKLRIPTRVTYGLTDVLVPALHGQWLARHVPGAEEVAEERLGHLSHPDLVTERFEWLVRPV